MSKHTARWMGMLIVAAFAGCVNLPMWKVPTPRSCQKAENEWGDVVDFIGHQSPIDQPCRDPRYCKRAVYRIAPYGIFEPIGEPLHEEIPQIETSSP